MRKFGYVQQIVIEFAESKELLKIVALPDRAYSNQNSARCAYRNAIKKLGYGMVTRIINGDLYLIKIQNINWTAKNYNRACHSCTNRYPSRECSTCETLSNYNQNWGMNNASMA